MNKYRLILLRHGESLWNLQNRFTGWTDIDLSDNGIIEAKNAGNLLLKERFNINLIFTSKLKRAISTMELCLNQMKLKNIETHYEWRLNERHYGALQGLNKTDTAIKYGESKVLNWRRSYDTAPPKVNIDDKRHPKFNNYYKSIKTKELPFSESLKDTVNRFLPLWDKKITPSIESGRNILIVAHGNSIRALVKILRKISNQEIINLNIPTGVPLIYELDYDLNVLKDFYLGNQNEINNRIESVSKEGLKKLTN